MHSLNTIPCNMTRSPNQQPSPGNVAPNNTASQQQQQHPQPQPMLLTQEQLQFLQQQSRQITGQQVASNTTSIRNNINTNHSPFIALAQLPMQVTPFGLQQQLSQLQQQPPQSVRSFNPQNQIMQQWAQLLQPTPIRSDMTMENNTNNSSRTNSSTTEPQSILQQFLAQAGLSAPQPDHSSQQPSTSCNMNEMLAPAGSIDLPSQQTLPTFVQPMNLRNTNMSGSCSNDMLLTDDTSKRKFSLTSSTFFDPFAFESSNSAINNVSPNNNLNNSSRSFANDWDNPPLLTDFSEVSSHQHQVTESYSNDRNNTEESFPQLQMQFQQRTLPKTTHSSHAASGSNHTPLNIPATVDTDEMSTSTTQSNYKNDIAESMPPSLLSQIESSLPSTLMPPTVMTSVLQVPLKKPAAPALRRRQGVKSTRVESPQDVLERMLSLRGYRQTRFTFKESNYDAKPTELQLASFGTALVRAVHHSDVETLSKLLQAGLSPNPCNQFRDSVVDLVCKRANIQVLECLLQHGCRVQVCDGFGRTPLHHCCWASDFSAETARAILQRDRWQLLLEDKRGQTPLEYVRAEQATHWITFLEDGIVNQLFPLRENSTRTALEMHKATMNALPPSTDPSNGLSPRLASAVSSGEVNPEEVYNPQVQARYA